MTDTAADGSRPRQSPRLPLRLVLIVPFLLQLFAAVGLTGWLSLTNGQKAVDDAISQLREELTRHVREYLDDFLHDAHWVNTTNADAIALGELDVRDPEVLSRHFLHQLDDYPAASYIFFGSALGGAAGAGRTEAGALTVDHTDVDPARGLVAGTRYEYAADGDGGRRELLSSTPGFDARRRPWFFAALEAAGPAWSEVYPLFVDKSLALAASRPVYAADGELLGVLAMDLKLSRVGDFLRRLDVGKTGETFIVERSGMLVASSTALAPFSVEGQEMKRHWAVDRPEPLIAETARFLDGRFGGLHRIAKSEQLAFDLAGERQFVQVSPLTDGRGIDWLIVTVVPAADFMERIHANTRTTIWLCAGALVLATGLGLVTSRWIARPVLRLNEASKALARGRWDHQVEARGVAEVEELAASFNWMAGELREAFEELESRVEQRTAELREAKEAADAANRAKSRFLADASHELRTPLASILGYLDLLHERDLPADAAAWIGTIRRNGKHLDRLLADLLDIGRIEAGRLELHVKPCNLAELLASLSSDFGPLAAERALRLDIATQNWLPWRFDADPVRLRQVLSNLLSNAIKYTQQGRVTLTVESARQPAAPETFAVAAEGPESTTLAFVVEDTGIGISAADCERLFQRFTRLDAATGSGFGLGLAITRQLVDLMGGEVTVRSRVGVGSRFTVRLPVTGCGDWAQEEKGYEKSGHIPLVSLPSLAGRVLIADDSRSLRELCRQMLARWGLDCALAADGREAVEIAARERFDAILMDWQMPGLDGLQATAELRRAGVETPVVALTAAAMSGDRERCLAAGCTDYLTKPIDFKELHRLLARLLGDGAAAPPAGADAEVEALLRSYLRGLPEQVAELRQRLAAGRWEPFHAAAHKLAGTAGTYGLDEIYRLAAALEKTGLARDAAAAARLLAELERAISRRPL